MCVFVFLSTFRIASVQCLRQDVPGILGSPCVSLRNGALHQTRVISALKSLKFLIINFQKSRLKILHGNR